MSLSQAIANLERENDRLSQENKEIRRLLESEPAKPKECQSCRFFIQHYVYCGNNQYHPTNCGHCVHSQRMKDRRASEKSCQYFELGKAR